MSVLKMTLCQPDVVSFFTDYMSVLKNDPTSARRCFIFYVQNLTDAVSFFLTVCRSLKNEFMQTRRWVIFYLTLDRSLKNDFMSARRCFIFYLSLCRSSGRFVNFMKYFYKGKFTQISVIFLI
jgi:hypothetical protein